MKAIPIPIHTSDALDGPEAMSGAVQFEIEKIGGRRSIQLNFGREEPELWGTPTANQLTDVQVERFWQAILQLGSSQALLARKRLMAAVNQCDNFTTQSQEACAQHVAAPVVPLGNDLRIGPGPPEVRGNAGHDVRRTEVVYAGAESRVGQQQGAVGQIDDRRLAVSSIGPGNRSHPQLKRFAAPVSALSCSSATADPAEKIEVPKSKRVQAAGKKPIEDLRFIIALLLS